MFEHLTLINNAIPQETYERVFIDVTNRQLDLPVDMQTSAAHVTLFWTEHLFFMAKTIDRNLLIRANGG